MIMMLKENDNFYQLLYQRPEKFGQFAILSSLNKPQYEFMLDFLVKMRDGNKIGDCYTFPRPENGNFTVVRLHHQAQDHYVIDGNYHHIFSEMIDIEFALMIFELECLPNHEAGTPAYFPPAKDKDNDR